MTTEEALDVTPDLDGGVLKTIVKDGVGVSTPTGGCTVTVHYEGKLTDGTVFDSSRERQPFEFELGKGSVIKAWDIGVATMKRGEIAKFVCQPKYAYGSQGSPPKIPPNATLIFEVEMISWRAEDISPKKDGSVLRTIINVGEGFSSPNDGATVDIHMTGSFNGTTFEDRDVLFPLGEGCEYQVCPGIEKALEKFKIKEKSKLLIKSNLAFGATGKPEFNIPPNAEVEYVVQLNNFEKLPDFWSLDPPAKREQAAFFKEKGGRYFKEGKYALACKMYQKMDSYVGNDVGFTGEDEEIRKELLKAMHLNLALCYLKLGKVVDARHECEKVLEADPENVKALFRKGLTYLNSAEPELAMKDFTSVLKSDPSNSAAARNLRECQEMLKKQRSQEKKIYANMFEKFAKHDKEEKNWVHGWWDGKQVNTEKYVPAETEEEELEKRRKERAALLKEFERKKKEMALRKAAEQNAIDDADSKSAEEGEKTGGEENENQDSRLQKSEEKEEEERKQLPDVMKTLGEWGQDEREREPTKFEMENPNILMLNRTDDFGNM